ncbi:hypothetical protein JW948_07385 [bacterium]|nr:hypothetical protein [bacterium]
MRTIQTVPAAVVLTVCLSCITRIDPIPPYENPDSPIVFAMTYTNYAWGYQHNGWYVNDEGRLYRTDKDTSFKFENVRHDSLFTKEILNQLLQAALMTDEILDRGTFSDMKNLIGPSVRGELSTARHLCADAGIWTYFAFTGDAASDGYRSVLLVMAGDWGQKNLSEEAAKLFGLLRQHVEGDTLLLPCMP